MSFKSFGEIGREIMTFGQHTDQSIADIVRSKIPNDRTLTAEHCLLVAVLESLDELPRKIAKAMASVQRAESKAEHDRAMQLEKQKQKTAADQLRAIEAVPPSVTIIQATNGDIARAFDAGRVLRRF